MIVFLCATRKTVSFPSVLPPSNQLDTSFVSRTVDSSLFGTGSSCKDKGEFGENGEFAPFAVDLGIKYDEIPSFDNITFIEDEGGLILLYPKNKHFIEIFSVNRLVNRSVKRNG